MEPSGPSPGRPNCHSWPSKRPKVLVPRPSRGPRHLAPCPQFSPGLRLPTPGEGKIGGGVSIHHLDPLLGWGRGGVRARQGGVCGFSRVSRSSSSSNGSSGSVGGDNLDGGRAAARAMGGPGRGTGTGRGPEGHSASANRLRGRPGAWVALAPGRFLPRSLLPAWLSLPGSSSSLPPGS